MDFRTFLFWILSLGFALATVLRAPSTGLGDSANALANMSTELTIPAGNERLSPDDIITIANDGRFEMDTSNMKEVDWISRYKDWEASALNSSSEQSLSVRYGKEKLGLSMWTCSSTHGCDTKPDPLRILEFVNSSSRDLCRDDVIEEAQARYWAAMTYWILFRFGSDSMESLKLGQAYVASSITSIILDFTKQEDAKTILMCDIKTWFIDQIWKRSMTIIDTGASQVKDKKTQEQLGKIKVTLLLDVAKDIVGFGLQHHYGYAYYEGHPGSDVTASPDFLRLASQGYTSDLYCGQMDGIKGTAGDNLWRMSDAGYHLGEIMTDYVKKVDGAYRTLNGLESNPNFPRKMSDWMENSNFEDTIHRLDDFNVGQVAEDWGKQLKGYLIGAALTANKCYMKCQSHLMPSDVRYKCEYEDFQNERFCPAERPDTVCQINCYTMLDSGNHEKPLIGLGKLQKHGFNSKDMMKNSWEHYLQYTNGQRRPQLEIESGQEFKFNGGNSTLMLSVSVSRTNIIADNPLKSKNFPCFSGDWHGQEVEAFMNRQGMGRNSTDWGEPIKGNPRAWEVFQHHCPEETRTMAPLTRYLNLICGLRLHWPGKSRRDWHPHNMILKPDHDHKNDDRCASLRAKVQDMDENTANTLFCLKEWPEAVEIFRHERFMVYTDYNLHSHRGSGFRFLYSHKINCRWYLRNTPRSFTLDAKYLGRDWSATHNYTKMTGPEADFTGTSLEKEEGEKDVGEGPDADSTAMEKVAGEGLGEESLKYSTLDG
ncbi:hypothetical protein DSL72_001926 [Monilinia vaccinii-corymbosi]|uniref:Uncharacterized protein n=1 Tax=Monilinia vaccinii-corymbosi TaxID=61207 RepID=A0A8A3PB68_9HELO|nr:hypothetical protein DSL72_001926 [Monilinia vaccinii-corymbosi]